MNAMLEMTYDKNVLLPTSESPRSSTVISGGGTEGSIAEVCGGPRLADCFNAASCLLFSSSGVDLGKRAKGRSYRQLGSGLAWGLWRNVYSSAKAS